jgi:hypothetical protein
LEDDQDVEWRITVKQVLQKYDGRVWSGLIWMRIGKSGGIS